MKDILKGSAIIFVFKIVGAASLFGVHLLIARHYGASTLGVFNLVLALLTFGAVFSRLGLDMYVVRMLPEIEGDRLLASGFLQKVFKILFVGSIVTMLLFMATSSLIDQYIFKHIDASSYLIVLAVMIVPFTYFEVIPEIFRGFQDIKIYSFYRNVSQNLFLLLTLSALLYFLSVSPDPVWLLYSVLCIISIGMVFHLYNFLVYKGIFILQKREYKKKILVYSYPMLFTSAMMILMANVDSLMIGYYLNEAQVGIYAACLKLALLITFVLASVNGFIAPKISKSYSKKDYGELKRIYFTSIRISIIVSLPVFLTLCLYPGFFLGLFGLEFKEASTTLMIISAAFVVNACFGPTGYMLNMTDNQNIFMWILLFGLIVNVSLNIMLIPIYSLNGAAFATVCSVFTWNILSLAYLKKRNGILHSIL